LDRQHIVSRDKEKIIVSFIKDMNGTNVFFMRWCRPQVRRDGAGFRSKKIGLCVGPLSIDGTFRKPVAPGVFVEME
jgi:hypothetical protein